MLRGNYPAKVDDKGRLKIPAAFLEELREQGSKFFVTSENGDFAQVYPMTVWNEIEEKLAKLPMHNRTKRKFLARSNYYGQMVDLDAQGRILVPTILRDAAQTKGDVVVTGQLRHLEIWNHARYLEHMKANPITEDDEKTLGDLGI